MERFPDRAAAGRRLGERLREGRALHDPVVLGLPRGGVPVAFEVAEALEAPLGVFVVRKLGVPGHEELAMGAIASGGARVVNDEVVDELGLTAAQIDAVARAEQRELERRETLYRTGRPAPDVVGRSAILVDDGLATGSTMRAAVAALRERAPAEVVVAVPVAAASTCRIIAGVADQVVCLEAPDPFWAVGLWYDEFDQTSDEEVRRLLELAGRR